jgi:hypothetical protein
MSEENAFEQNHFEEAFSDTKEVAIQVGSVEWNDYVLGLLDVDEKDDKGRPRCDGLRRVFNQVFDVIVSHSTERVFLDNEVVVNWETVFVPHKEIVFSDGGGIPTRTVSALASASTKNTNPPFDKFLAAIADTRAEARCYRKALLLRGPAAEEMEENEEVEAGPASESQIQTATFMAGRLAISVPKLLAYNRKEIAPKSKVKSLTLEKLSGEEMKRVLSLLNRYQGNGDLEVPQEVKLA